MIQDIFKIGIYKYYLGETIDNKKLETYSYKLKEKNNIVTKSNRGGFHSENLDPYCEDLKKLTDVIIKHANIFSDELKYGKLNIDNIWCNINSYKDYNDLHCHPNTKISGVYYVKTPENCGNIEFHNPAYHILSQSLLARSDNNYTSLSWWMPSTVGVLYLFPCWLLHLVKPNMNQYEDRISYSFNLDNKK
jgi:uncharacterized protein (TIGR02466 family)